MTFYIPELPEEIHCSIARYVHRDDLPKYRLASKQFCAIGTEELFHTVTFHYSTRSIERLEMIAGANYVRKHVKAIVWDTNLWKIPDISDLHQWKSYFFTKAEFFQCIWTHPSSPHNCGLVTHYSHLSENRKEWEAYLDKLADEKDARQKDSNFAVLLKFQQLRTIQIANGTLIKGHRGLENLDDQFTYPVDQLTLRRGEGVHDMNSRPGFRAFSTIQMLPGLSLKQLYLDRIHYSAFSLPINGDFSNLTKLTLKVTIRKDTHDDQSFKYLTDFSRSLPALRQGHLIKFLVTLQRLEILRLDFDSLQGRRCDSWFTQPPSSIIDIFGCETWPKLRELSLCHLFASSNSLLALFERHTSTLRILSLRNIQLDKSFEVMQSKEFTNFWTDRYDQEQANHPTSLKAKPVSLQEWPQILPGMSKIVHLEQAKISGRLWADHHANGWDLDQDVDLAAAAGRYLVVGGQIPLDDSNCLPQQHR